MPSTNSAMVQSTAPYRSIALINRQLYSFIIPSISSCGGCGGCVSCPTITPTPTNLIRQPTIRDIGTFEIDTADA
ncbi:MAG: hypothetical protein KME28_01440 [Pelatocladus maniniholoensis HA4357-MV3]|uniref:Uncharacterized protein n=1 Tax=Pelatocladus maniniholoensis HA4357-MV3 TaxID=1117104 RepID=A0A9E3LQH9_9NOST|nr:hypothetical protein [Pelatocladus maniniholoensis HA4357-MV3]